MDRAAALLLPVAPLAILGLVASGWQQPAELPQPEEAQGTEALLSEGPDPPPESGVLPTRAVPARPPDPDRLAVARSFLAGGTAGTAGRLGPYALYTDLQDPERLAWLGRVVARLEEVYRARYDRDPLGAPAEAVVLYAEEKAYRAYQAQDQQVAELEARGHSGYGIVSLADGGRPRRDVAATLVHELAHLINRRALGPLLPSWLDEGIADDLAQSRIEEDGRVQPGTLTGVKARGGRTVQMFGSIASLYQLAQRVETGTLRPTRELLDLPWEGFVRSEGGIHYLHASFWIRYLLDGESGALAPGFRAYLDAVAEGEPATAEALRERLGRSWEELDAGFREWVRVQAASVAGL